MADGRGAGVCGALRGPRSLCAAVSCLPTRPAWTPRPGLPGAGRGPGASPEVAAWALEPREGLAGGLRDSGPGRKQPRAAGVGSWRCALSAPGPRGVGDSRQPPNPLALPTSTPEHAISAEQTRPERRCCGFKRSCLFLRSRVSLSCPRLADRCLCPGPQPAPGTVRPGRHLQSGLRDAARRQAPGAPGSAAAPVPCPGAPRPYSGLVRRATQGPRLALKQNRMSPPPPPPRLIQVYMTDKITFVQK